MAEADEGDKGDLRPIVNGTYMARGLKEEQEAEILDMEG